MDSIQKRDAGDADPRFMERAIELAVDNVRRDGGGPFGAVIVRNGQVIATGTNRVAAVSDPTAHAEIVAIRNACRESGVFHLEGFDLYTSCEPCPMCLGAIYWAHIGRVFYSATRRDAASAGFDDELIYSEIATPVPSRRCHAAVATRVWRHSVCGMEPVAQQNALLEKTDVGSC